MNAPKLGPWRWKETYNTETYQTATSWRYSRPQHETALSSKYHKWYANYLNFVSVNWWNLSFADSFLAYLNTLLQLQMS